MKSCDVTTRVGIGAPGTDTAYKETEIAAPGRSCWEQILFSGTEGASNAHGN